MVQPLRKNLGNKNCELADTDIERIVETFVEFEESEQSRIFDNAEFGYWKVTVERPLRAKRHRRDARLCAKEIKALKEEGRIAGRRARYPPHSQARHDEADPLRGLFPLTIAGKRCVVEYEPDSDLRDTETVPLKEPAVSRPSSAARCCRMRQTPGSTRAKTAIGYEISFTRYFYKPQPLRPLEAIRADILALGARN